MKKKKAVVLLSGGLDSATALFDARRRGYDVFGLAFDYGQRHRKELGSAKRLARRAGCSLVVLKIRLPWKGSSLLDRKSALPRNRARMDGKIPSTYVPARNTIFISYGLSYAEVLGASAIFIGANALDYSGYPDCRPSYFKMFNRLSKLATKNGVEGDPVAIETPLISLTKAQIIRRGLRLGVPYELTWSCYEGGSVPCGACDSCRLRQKGFKQAGVVDPLVK